MKTECFYFSEDHKYTHNFLRINFLLAPFSKQFRLLFLPAIASLPFSPWVGGQLMKGCSQSNMGETYHGFSQPSHISQPAIKNSGQLMLSPPESFPLSLGHLRCSQVHLSFSYSLFFSPIVQFQTFSQSYQYSAPYHWPLRHSISEPYSPYLPFSSTLISISFFLLSCLLFYLFFYLFNVKQSVI